MREVTMKAGHGRVDYLLHVDRKVVGVIEAKPVGTTLAGVEWQSARYANGLPLQPNLPEADASDMDYFVGQLQIVLPVLGVNAFRTRRATPVTPTAEPVESPTFSLSVPRHGIDAQATQVDGEFPLLAGGKVVGAWSRAGGTESVQRICASHRVRFDKLIDDGSIDVDGSLGTVTRDIAFSSSSTAGAAITGRSCSGREK